MDWYCAFDVTSHYTTYTCTLMVHVYTYVLYHGSMTHYVPWYVHVYLVHVLLWNVLAMP
jgi:hypothetical protein